MAASYNDRVRQPAQFDRRASGTPADDGYGRRAGERCARTVRGSRSGYSGLITDCQPIETESATTAPGTADMLSASGTGGRTPEPGQSAQTLGFDAAGGGREPGPPQWHPQTDRPASAADEQQSCWNDNAAVIERRGEGENQMKSKASDSEKVVALGQVGLRRGAAFLGIGHPDAGARPVRRSTLRRSLQVYRRSRTF